MHSAAGRISIACSRESKNLTEMLLELSCNIGTELFVCVLLILDKGVIHQPSKENKASVQAVISRSTWTGHHNIACLDLEQSEYLDHILDND
jgi:hypothetical protein